MTDRCCSLLASYANELDDPERAQNAHEFSKSLHSTELTAQQAHIWKRLQEPAWPTHGRHNPLSVEELLLQALVRFERCLAYSERHLALQEAAVAARERIATRRDVRLLVIRHRIETLEKAKEQRESVKHLLKESRDAYQESVTRLDELFANEHGGARDLVEGTQGEQPNQPTQVETARINDHDTQLNLRGPHTNAARRQERRRINRERWQLRAQKAQALGALRRQELEFQRWGHRIDTLTKDLDHEKELAAAEKKLADEIEESLTVHGPLKFHDRWRTLAGYYQADFLSGYERLVAAIYGLGVAYGLPTTRWPHGEEQPPPALLPDTIALTRGLVDKLDTLASGFVAANLCVPLRHLVPSQGLDELAQGAEVVLSLDTVLESLDDMLSARKQVLLRAVECRAEQGTTPEEFVLLALTPPPQAIEAVNSRGAAISRQVQPGQILLSPQREGEPWSAERRLHNVRFAGQWVLQGRGSVSTLQNLTLVFRVLVGTAPFELQHLFNPGADA